MTSRGTARAMNRLLRCDDSDQLLNNAATVVPKCKSIARTIQLRKSTKRQQSIPPALSDTSGRIYGKFLILLFILAHRQTFKFFETFGEEPSNESFTWRCAEYFFHNRVEIGLTCAQVTAIHTHVAPHTTWRLRFPLSRALQDPLLLPFHPPRSAQTSSSSPRPSFASIYFE